MPPIRVEKVLTPDTGGEVSMVYTWGDPQSVTLTVMDQAEGHSAQIDVSLDDLRALVGAPPVQSTRR